jgi:hypothetical protein
VQQVSGRKDRRSFEQLKILPHEHLKSKINVRRQNYARTTKKTPLKLGAAACRTKVTGNSSDLFQKPDEPTTVMPAIEEVIVPVGNHNTSAGPPSM